MESPNIWCPSVRRAATAGRVRADGPGVRRAVDRPSQRCRRGGLVRKEAAVTPRKTPCPRRPRGGASKASRKTPSSRSRAGLRPRRAEWGPRRHRARAPRQAPRGRVERLYLRSTTAARSTSRGPVTVRRGSITAPLHGEAGEAVRVGRGAHEAAAAGRRRQRPLVHAVARDERVIAVGSRPRGGDARRPRRHLPRRWSIVALFARSLDDGRVHLLRRRPPHGRGRRGRLRGGAGVRRSRGIVLTSLGAFFLAHPAPATAFRFWRSRCTRRSPGA